ncbi:MAG: cyclopropane-fatty-acyl-phospholipid synthase family protein [Pseudomonadota bacterium]
MKLLPILLRQVIKAGSLTLSGPGGYSETFSGDIPGPDVTIKVNDATLDRKLMLNPELRFAEAYMDGGIDIAPEDLREVLRLFKLNQGRLKKTKSQSPFRSAAKVVKKVIRNNPIRSKSNVAAHYDIGNDLYRLFLDDDLQYTMAYYPNGDETLEEAQLAKKRHVAAKLMLRPGQKVLEFGCGWGGMALYLAQVADVEVTAVTLAEEQVSLARERAAALGLSDRVKFELMDYRAVEGKFDRVFSVGILEHIGASNLPVYFKSIRDRLAPGGVSVTHSIVRMNPPGLTSPFTAKYIFPGGYIPSFSETMAAVERNKLWLTDCEVLRKHYAFTLRDWANRFAAHRDEAKAMYDERFCRMWELYLLGAESSFLDGRMANMHLQMGLERDAVPLSRDYMVEETDRLKKREREVGIVPAEYKAA